MTAELLICVMPGEGCRFQHGKHSSNYFSGGYWPKMYSTGQRRKSVYSQEKYLNIKQWKKSLTPSLHAAAMCFAKHTPILELCVLTGPPSQGARTHVIFGEPRIRWRLFTLLCADCSFIFNLACWAGVHSKVQRCVAAAGEDAQPG